MRIKLPAINFIRVFRVVTLGGTPKLDAQKPNDLRSLSLSVELFMWLNAATL